MQSMRILNEEHLKREEWQKESFKVCKCLCYIMPLIGLHVDVALQECVALQSGRSTEKEYLEDFQNLMDICQSLNFDQEEEYIFSGKTPLARLLASWYDENAT